MSDVVVMRMEAASAVIGRLTDTAESLDEVKNTVESLAKSFEDGNLLGKAGEAFANALRNTLNKKIDKIHELCINLAFKVNAAKNDLVAADKSGASKM